MITLNTNLDSLNATHQLDLQRVRLNKPIERISSGQRINGAGDDVAGLSISTRLSASQRGLTQAVRNAQDAISFTQTAEGALGEVSNLLQRLRELSVQSASELYSDGQRGDLQKEASQLIQEIDKIGGTRYNKRGLFGEDFRFHVGSGAEVEAGLYFVSQRLSSDRLGAHSNYTSAQGVDTSLGLASGDLTIITREGEEVRVRATREGDDTLSTVARSGSAISKAAAINEGTASHGVRATAGPTTLASTGIGASVTLGNNDSLTINGVQISGVTIQAGDADGTLVREVNAVSRLTGVTASRNDQGMIELSAEDGRNIAIGAQGTATGLGFADGTIQGGQLTLTSTQSYTLRFSDASVNSATLGGVANIPRGSGSSPSLTSRIISTGEVTFASGGGGGNPSAYSVGTGGFNANTEVTSVTGAYVSGGIFSNPQTFYGYFANGQMYLSIGNDTDVDVTSRLTDSGISGSNTFSINGSSVKINYQTGSIDSTLKLTGSPGLRDYQVSGFKLELSEASVAGGGGPVEAYMTKRLDSNHVASIDLSTARGAKRALGILDVALEEVNYYRGNLGATQSRLGSMVNNFEQARYDLSNAYSRINDADFAQEVTQLSSAQIIQSAGISVLSQANTSFATALSLISTGAEPQGAGSLYS